MHFPKVGVHKTDESRGGQNDITIFDLIVSCSIHFILVILNHMHCLTAMKLSSSHPTIIYHFFSVNPDTYNPLSVTVYLQVLDSLASVCYAGRPC